VARPELGTKRICPTTGRKFYDLDKDPVISPYSGEIVPIAALAPYARGAAPVVARKVPDADEEEVETEGPELVSLDEVDAEETEKDTDTDLESDDALVVEDDAEVSEDDTLVVEEDDEDDTTDLVDVADDDDD
jgi:uncharacterized protein (TIGR02300 family)